MGKVVRQIGLLPGYDKEIAAPEKKPEEPAAEPERPPSQRKCSDHARATSIAAKPLTKREIAASGWDRGMFAGVFNPDTGETTTATVGRWDALRPQTVADCELKPAEADAWSAYQASRARLRDEEAARTHEPLSPEERAALDVLAVSRATGLPYARAALVLSQAMDKRPCPWISCQFNLAIEVREDLSGSLKVLWPETDASGDLMPAFETMPETCTLDVARRVAGEGKLLELEEIARLMNRSLERIHQIESEALQSLRVRDMIRSMIEERGDRLTGIRIPDAARKKEE